MKFMFYMLAAWLAAAQPDEISRIYYLNLPGRHDRQTYMENWLGRQSVPFERVQAMRGHGRGCVSNKTDTRRCTAITGIIRTMRYVINTLNTTGLTLVLEDDHEVQVDQLIQWVPHVPDDWDIIRFDCTRPKGILPEWIDILSKDVYRTEVSPQTRCSNCQFCGGTHIMLWRDGDSLRKLRKLWSQPPYDDIDCLLKTKALKSYCVDANVSKTNWNLAHKTDNPKV